MTEVYWYVWINIATKQYGFTNKSFLSKKDFLNEMNRWNMNQPGIWVYIPMADEESATNYIKLIKGP